MAGTTIASLEAVCGGSVVRAMPNTPAAIGRGITVAVGSQERQRRTARDCGCAVARHRRGGMGRQGKPDGRGDRGLRLRSGLVFLLAEELARAGVAAGLPAELAGRLARETVAGSGELLLARNWIPPRCARMSLRQAAPRPPRWTCDGAERPAAAADARRGRGDAAFEGSGEVVCCCPHGEEARQRRLEPCSPAGAPRHSSFETRFRAPQDEVEQRSYFPARLLVNISALTKPRAWRPSPILRSPSKASTSKRMTRRSTAKTFPVTRTVAPTSDAPRWRISTSVPTVISPAADGP